MLTRSTFLANLRLLGNLNSLFLGFLVFLLLNTSSSYGEILRVNNQLKTDNAQKIYATLQEAHDLGKAGDTLMVEGSSVLYTGATFTKKLFVIGTGYFLDENSGTHAVPIESRLGGNLNLNSGSEGTFIIGLVFTNIYFLAVSVNDIVIMRCYFPSYIGFRNNIQNVKILQNYFAGNNICFYAYANLSFSNFEFNNNLVRGTLVPGSNPSFVFSQVNNNVFLGGNSSQPINIRTGVFRSNIVASQSNIIVLSNNIQNNLTLGEQLSGNGNQTYAAAQLFVGESGTSTDGQYRIKSDSPYLKAGYQNTEPGVFGGSTPYTLSGLPPVPSITDFSANSFGSKEGGLSIQIKAKSNF